MSWTFEQESWKINISRRERNGSANVQSERNIGTKKEWGKKLREVGRQPGKCECIDLMHR